jgi:hypothetical protein
LDLVFPEQPNPSRERRDHQSRSEKSEQTGSFCIETENAPRGYYPEKEIAGSHRVNPRGKAVLIPEKFISRIGGVSWVFFKTGHRKTTGLRFSAMIPTAQSQRTRRSPVESYVPIPSRCNKRERTLKRFLKNSTGYSHMRELSGICGIVVQM